MASEDPFFAVKDEVLLALVRTRRLWSRLEQSEAAASSSSTTTKLNQEELEWTRTELKNALRSIEWDLEDLDDTITIVEKNPNQFKIDPTEIQVRKSFIKTTRNEVVRLKNQAGGNSSKQGTSKGDSGRGRLSSGGSSGAPEDDSEGDWLLRGGGGTTGQDPQHQLLQEEQQQDDTLVIMSDSMDTLRNMSEQIGQELDEQAAMLDEFGTEIENAETKLDATMKKMSKVLHLSTDKRQWFAIAFLAGAIVFVLFLLALF